MTIWVPRKRKIFVPPAGQPYTLEQRLKHPHTGADVFGVLPPVVHASQTIFDGGEIVLRYGKHIGNQYSQNGFGFLHIWARRFPNITNHTSALQAVTEFVAGIIRPGTAIYWEEGSRAAIFCSKNGEVIVEERGGPGNRFYSVVTAIKQPVTPKGSRLGALA